jgi:hypothetical protein
MKAVIAAEFSETAPVLKMNKSAIAVGVANF